MQALQQARLTDAWLQFERALLTIQDTKRWNDKVATLVRVPNRPSMSNGHDVIPAAPAVRWLL